jgi:toxin-antitoxin system PIN domain toxin
MKRCLLDVNVFFAMVWPMHSHYDAARAWFKASGGRAWATNPLTQLGVLRLLSNPRITEAAVPSLDALETVADAISHDGHEFWDLGHRMTNGLRTSADRVQGYRQWTDALLLWQAVSRNGVLVTFDSGVRELAGRDHRDSVLLLKR